MKNGLRSTASFPEKGSGVLYYQNDYISVRIAAYPANAAEFATRIKNFNTAQLSFRCPSPYWEAVEEMPPSYMAYVEGGFSFPLEFAPENDHKIQFASRSNHCTVVNGGTVPTPVRLTILGPAKNPSVINPDHRRGHFHKEDTRRRGNADDLYEAGGKTGAADRQEPGDYQRFRLY